MIYHKKTLNSVNSSSRRADYWQRTERENATIKYHFTLKEILFFTAMTAAEKEQISDVSHKVYI